MFSLACALGAGILFANFCWRPSLWIKFVIPSLILLSASAAYLVIKPASPKVQLGNLEVTGIDVG
jgi:hypothetical protein